MLCSKCSEPVLPIVALDIDGTLGNYHGHLWSFMCGYFGRDLPVGWTGNPPDWEEFLGLTKAEYREVKLAFRQGGLKRTMPPYDGAVWLSHSAHEMGAEVWITTTRPWMRLDSVDPDTREWLGRNGIYYDRLLYDDDKYKKLAELVDLHRVAFVLDDLPEMYDQADACFSPGVVYLRQNTHNLAYHRPFKVDDLKGAHEVMERKLRNWRNEHE